MVARPPRVSNPLAAVGVRGDLASQAVDVFLLALRVALAFFAIWTLIGTIALHVNNDGIPAALWRDNIVGGVAQGFMYGLIALGYSMVYGVLGFINFAHGEVFMSGAMSGYFVADALFEAGMWEDNFIIAFLIVAVAAVVTSTLVAVIVERIAYRPLRGAPRLIPLITSIGISFFIQYAVRGLFGDGFKTVPVLPEGLNERVNVLGLQIEGVKLMVILLAITSMIGLYFFVERSKTGRAIRAVAEDKEIAALMGINVDRTIVTTFAVGGAMAGVGGLLWSLLFRKVFFLTGFLPGIKAFTAAVLGGIGNLPGAMLGGLTLGMVEGSGPIVLKGLSWEIPDWIAYLIALAGLAMVVTGMRWARSREARLSMRGFSYGVVGILVMVLGVFVFPGFSVVIPGVSQLKDMMAFVVLIGVLMFRPVGLLGERLSVEDRA